MKKTFFVLLISGFAVYSTAQQNFEVMHKKPVAGSVISFEYMPRSTVLQGVKDFEAVAYLMEGKLPLAKSVTLKQEGGIFKGSVKTNDSTKAVFFTFAKDAVQDNNNDAGYYTPLYDKKGNIVAGANLALASGFTNYGSIWGLKRNKEKAALFNNEEFAIATSREKFLTDYLAFLSSSTNEADRETLKTELQQQLSKKNVAEADLSKAKYYYETVLKDQEKATAITVLLKQNFPAGTWKRTDDYNAFFKLKTKDEKEMAYTRFVANYGPFSKDDLHLADAMAGGLARMNADSSNWDAVNNYLTQIKSNTTKANTLNSIAWKLAGQGMLKKPLDAKKGIEYSLQSMAAINDEKKIQASKPAYYTDKEYVKNLTNSYYSYSDTYATLLYHNGELQKAYDVEKLAVENFKGANMSMNESYSFLTEKIKGTKEAQSELEKFFIAGKYTPAMKEQLKTIYLAGGNTEDAWKKYATNLEEIAYNKLKEELAKKMINMPAPLFALKDMSGKEVALETLKGKVVVVDFWATWCGPCIASFPGMQRTVNKFKDNPDVVFLFIDTWENDSNRVQKVTDFIAKNKYSFQVLYDEAKAKVGNDFVVIEKYKVDGIPTKFVIDKNNNIRFKSVGYNGSADAIVNELSAMIEMAGTEVAEGTRKAF